MSYIPEKKRNNGYHFLRSGANFLMGITITYLGNFNRNFRGTIPDDTLDKTIDNPKGGYREMYKNGEIFIDSIEAGLRISLENLEEVLDTSLNGFSKLLSEKNKESLLFYGPDEKNSYQFYNRDEIYRELIDDLD